MEELKLVSVFEKSISDMNLLEFKDKAFEFKSDIKIIKNKLRDLSENNKSSYNKIKYEAISSLKSLIDELEKNRDKITKSSNINGIVLNILLGDINRYLVELHYGNDETLEPMSLYVQNSLINYREAMDLSEDLPHSNELKIATLLNLSVLIVDEMFNVEEGLTLCKEYVSKVKVEELSEYGNRVYEIILDNIEYWTKNFDLYNDQNKFSNK